MQMILDLLVSGDSIAKGVVLDPLRNRYTPIRQNCIALLQNELGATVRNTARFGNTLARGLRRLKDDVLAHRPACVLLEYGGNDCDFNWQAVIEDPYRDHQCNTPYETFVRLLRDAVAFLQENGVRPVLMSLPPLNPDAYLGWISGNDPKNAERILAFLGYASRIYWWQERYSAAALTVAHETGAAWVDVRGAFLQRDDFLDLLCADGIHPDPEGHRVIARALCASFKAGCAFRRLKDGARP